MLSPAPTTSPATQAPAKTTGALMPSQVKALREITHNRGGVVYLPPGGGKTLVAQLAPLALGCTRAIFLTKKGLLDQFHTEVAAYLSLGFPVEMSRFVACESHEKFSHPSGEHMLRDLQPDCIIIDEAVSFADHQSNRGMRFFKYVAAYARDPENAARDESTAYGGFLPVIVMDGAFLKKELFSLWRMFLAALKGSTPLPVDYLEAKDFCALVDGEFSTPRARRQADAMLQPRADETIRKAFGRHFRSRPGVVFPDSNELATRPDGQPLGLVLNEICVPPPVEVAEALSRVENTWCDPNGKPFDEATEKYRLTQQLSVGFWSEPPDEPDWYRTARLDWQHVVDDYRRKPNAESDSGATLEALLKEGADIKALKGPWKVWSALKDQWVRPDSVVHPVSSWAVDWAVEWAKVGGGAGSVIWVISTEVGEALARRGIPYFGDDSDAELAKEDGSRCVVLSIQAHATGKNLQKQGFWRNLLLEFYTTARECEQLLARTHRYGQARDAVTADVWLPTVSQRAKFLKVIKGTEADHERTQLGFRLRLLSQYQELLEEAEGAKL